MLELSSRCLRPVINADAHEMYVLHAESIAPFLHLLRDRAASSSPRVVKVNHSGRPSDGFGETDPFHPRAVRRELDHVEFGASRPDESHRRPSTLNVRNPRRAPRRVLDGTTKRRHEPAQCRHHVVTILNLRAPPRVPPVSSGHTASRREPPADVMCAVCVALGRCARFACAPRAPARFAHHRPLRAVPARPFGSLPARAP